MGLKEKNQLVSFKKVIKGENFNSGILRYPYKSLGEKFFIRCQKGGILPYVLMISMFILLDISFAMKSFENRNFYLKNYKEYVLEENKSHSHKEYLMGTFNKYMEENIDEISEKTIDVYFKDIKVDQIFRYDKSFIKYNSDKLEFEIDAGHRLYRFVPVIEDNKITYSFKEINI